MAAVSCEWREWMKHVGVLVLTLTIGCVAFAQNPAPRIVDLKAADGTLLKRR
jgi:hypothetical protein